MTERKHIYKLISAISIVVVFIIWVVLTRFEMINPLFIPSPKSVWLAFIDVLQNGYKGNTLATHIFDSLYRLLIAFALALVTAIPLGLLGGSIKWIRAIFEPFIEFYRPLPPLAYYTLLVLWFGIENGSKIALLYLAAFAPLYIAAMSSVQKIPQDRIRVAHSLGTNKLNLFTNIILPSTLPDLFTGIRTAVGFTYTTLVAAEMIAATTGIGWMVLDASKFLRSDYVIMGIFIMAILALLLDFVIRSIEKKLVPWKGKE